VKNENRRVGTSIVLGKGEVTVFRHKRHEKVGERNLSKPGTRGKGRYLKEEALEFLD